MLMQGMPLENAAERSAKSQWCLELCFFLWPGTFFRPKVEESQKPIKKPWEPMGMWKNELYRLLKRDSIRSIIGRTRKTWRIGRFIDDAPTWQWWRCAYLPSSIAKGYGISLLSADDQQKVLKWVLSCWLQVVCMFNLCLIPRGKLFRSFPTLGQVWDMATGIEPIYIGYVRGIHGNF